MTHYETLKYSILSDRTTSEWLKDAIAKLDKRDPCDVVADLEMLNFLSNVRLQSLHRQHRDSGLLLLSAEV